MSLAPEAAAERYRMHRRRWLQTAVLSAFGVAIEPAALGASDFWNHKEPSEWSSEEVLLLTTRSPWAHDTRLDLKVNGQGGGGRPANADATIDPGRGAAIGSSGGRTPAKSPNIFVTWESAQPLLDALHYPVPKALENRYIVGVNNLPILIENGRLPRRSQRVEESDTPRGVNQAEIVDWLKDAAWLRAKGKEPLQAGVVSTAREGSMILFGFSRELLALSRDDKEVIFAVDSDQFALKAKFEPREMIYHGKLAL